jgi:hypothetical protein
VADDPGEALVRRYYEEALNPGRFDRLDNLLANEFRDHEELRGIPPTLEGLKQKYTMLRTGFTDFGFTIEDLFSVDDRQPSRVHLTRRRPRQLGSLRGISAPRNLHPAVPTSATTTATST